ncbi:sugar kinase [Amphibacillus sp. MSJ-3]|uniref:carbohydrate kinase family protein n=1 Tax=Amphibacillus sp. MSJ-3 TaxID=2841505 RepID=UPI001C0F0B88|nr:sugar kinase [Amphibacillus sp. MSJ-3]MBU5595584.1 sugar kinase [Amphibacillus sp. MSJ-3]
MWFPVKLNDRLEFSNKKIDVLAIGEILVDLISTSYADLMSDNRFNAYFGGSPANIAMNIKRLGGQSQICAAVGTDAFGDFLIGHLKKQGMDTSLIQQVKQSTSMVAINKSKGTPIPVFYRGADYHLQLTDQLKQEVEQTKIIHFSSWPISRPESRNIVKEVIELARKDQTLVCFDPNYHKSLWDDAEDGIEFIKEMISYADIIKPSDDDAQRLFGLDTPENQIEKFHQLGCPFVIMTLGAEGAIVSIEGKKRYYPSFAKKVVDTTGAGDAFWSGFYVGLTQGETIEQALNIGFKVSAYKLKYTGAVVDLPHYKKLSLSEEAYDDIK